MDLIDTASPPLTRGCPRITFLLLAIAIPMMLPALAFATGNPGTAQANVHVLPPMTMDSLDRQRTVRIYLPPGYGDSDRRYPVLYMHDGQNLFDTASSYAGEWRVDETLNRLATERGLELIVVGIDHGGEHRIHELTPFDHPEYGAAEGAAYLEFLVGQLKPFVDARFNTMPGRDHTAIMGSSLGGLISHYALLRYPEVFSRAAVFSPAYWVAPGIYPLAAESADGARSRLYLLMGGAEGEDMVSGYLRMQTLLQRQIPPSCLRTRLVPDGGHNEGFWRDEFARAVNWLFPTRPAAGRDLSAL
ncbi:alpha/beta hydrolase [Microbulbifer sediminum]|uniref:alpha/beta hydrolase n=1 Tax=Microbulbifer sediminum TaxID=2904250 RepID=UPI001EEE712D|nr:alpha/beta hydrolase-fold protein [Microbulbifer sediminum]